MKAGIRSRKIILLLILICSNCLISAQNALTIGAILETDTFLWTLDTISLYSDSTILHWKVRAKHPQVKLEIPNHFYICDLDTGLEYTSICDLNTTMPNNTIVFQEPYEIKKFKTHFPVIYDSTTIAIHISPTLYIDSINLASSSYFYDVHKFRVPLYNHSPLLSHNDSINYHDHLYNTGIDDFNNKDYLSAIIQFEKALAIARQIHHSEGKFVLGNSFNEEMWLANCYYKLGMTDDAKSYSSTYYVEPYNKVKRLEADSLERVALWKYDQEKLIILEKICILDSMNIGDDSFRYAESLYDLGRQYSIMKNFSKAKHYFDHAITILKKKYKVFNWLLSSIYKEYAKVLYKENDFISAISYSKKSINWDNETSQILDDDIFDSGYIHLANYFSAIGEWGDAQKIMLMRVEYFHRLFLSHPRQKVNPNAFLLFSLDYQYAYSVALSDYADFLYSAGYYKLASRYYKQSMEIAESTNSYITHEAIGDYYLGLCDYNSALLHYQKAADDYLSNPINNEYQDHYLSILRSIAISYAGMDDMDAAIDLQKDIVNKADSLTRRKCELFGQWEADYGTYANYLSNLSRYYNLNNQYDSAIILENKSLDLKLKYAPDNSKLAYSILNLGYSYMGLQQWEKSFDYLLRAYNIYSQNREPIMYLRSLSGLSKCYFHSSDYSNLMVNVSLMIELISKDLQSNLKEQTYLERSRYIEQYSELLSNRIPMYAYYVPSDSLISSAYNASLLIKGALLVSENSIKHIINESHDESLKTLWEELRADRYILSKQLEKDSLERKLNIDSLQNVIYNLEDSLVVRCKEYDVITKNMSLKWDAIRDCLTQQDVAIEFLRIPINNDSIIYAALTLRKDSKAPNMTVLFEEKQLKDVSDTLYYQCKEMSDLVWKPLLPELQGIKNVYFAPSGALYNIGIEYLPGMENYNIYRLSSTRELVTRRETRTGNRAVLYGGLDYYAQLDTLSRSRGLAALSETFIEHADVRGLNVRGGMERLKHTQEEVELIGKELNKANWTCLLDTASIGTEESFKSLSGKQINTLHIATHGFYYTQEEADNKGYQFMLLDDNRTSAEDKALTRSGLLMAGANHVLDGDTLPDNVEDGILTAKEIADIDLRGLDMVVLSACQTGLGDIAQSEGVFGLQRGFKKAGAKAILMSLWEVDDKATQILMTQFYKNFVSGLTKHQALKSAQKYLREVEGGKYDEPKYWAAFVLLDGIK